MPKELLYNTEARNAIKRGVDKLANAVKVTLGAKGRNVVIGAKYSPPHITKDGVTVARAIELKDPFENIGAELVKEVASKTNDVAGDGTTTATVLAQAIITEGIKLVEAGYNPIDIKRGVDLFVEKVEAHLKEQATEINTLEEKKNIASISANDKAIGSLVAEALDKVGKDGVVTVDESNTSETYVEYVDGIQLEKGFISPYFTNNESQTIAAYKNVPVLVTDKKLSSTKDILPLLEQLNASGKKELVIIAEDVELEALSFLVVNKMQGRFLSLAIKAPGFGDRRKELLQDIAILTGGKLVSDELGNKMTIENLGNAQSVSATKDTTTIVATGNETECAERVAQIKAQLETASDFDKEKLQKRLANFTNGVAVIKVGATTETELKEKKDRIEDSLNATKAALDEGIVPGGGIALLRASYSLTEGSNWCDAMMIRVLKTPICQIAHNAGMEPAEVIHRTDNGRLGYNAENDTYCDMVENGIVDPVKVTRLALKNAASVAGLFLTTECVIADELEIKE